MTITYGVLDIETRRAGSESELSHALPAQTIGAVAPTGTFHDTGMTQEAHKAPPTGDREAPARDLRRQTRATGQIDVVLVKKAREIVDSIAPSDEFETPLFLTALAGTIMEMWESAATASEHHQDILAVLENAVRSAAADGSISDQHLPAFREALADLAQTCLVRENAEIIRSEFIRQGFGPLAFLEESDETENEESP